MSEYVHVFDEDEDNNPFSSTQGLTSLINSRADPKTGAVYPDAAPDDLVLLYKKGPANTEQEHHDNANGHRTNAANESTVHVNGAFKSNINGNAGNRSGINATSTTTTGTSKTSPHEEFNRIQINYESRVTKLLKPHSKMKVTITEASNSNEGVLNSLKKYVVYTIKLTNLDKPNEDIQTRRRYSDFESLREILTKIFPLVIVPPIPPKNYFNLNVLNGLVNSLVSSGVVSGTSPLQSNGHSSGSHNQHTLHHHHTAHSNAGNSGSVGESSKDDSKNPISISLPNNNYAYINLNHLNKHKLVEHRKRLLTNFLNNCLEIPKIRNLEFFAKFLDPNANWLDEVNLITSQLPKLVYQLNPENGLQTDSAYASLPIPTSNIPFLNKLKKLVGEDKSGDITSNGNGNGDNIGENGGVSVQNGLDSEIIDTSVLDEVNKRIMENFIGLSNDYTELGSIFNMFLIDFSDSEEYQTNSYGLPIGSSIKLNLIFDKIGQVFDRLYITLNLLISDLETKFSEPLGEAVGYSLTLQLVRRFKEKKNKQAVLLDKEVLEKKKEYNDLINAEAESQRLEGANPELQRNTKYDLNGGNKASNNSGYLSSVKSGGKYKMFLMLLIKKITQYVSDIIDQNPEETRKQKINSLHTKIEILEKCQLQMGGDIAYIADELNKNFEDFHQMQLKMIYEILVCYNGFLIDWAKKNLEIWEEIKEEIEKL